MVRLRYIAQVFLLVVLAPGGARPMAAEPPRPGPDVARIREWNRVGQIADAERAARSLLRSTEQERGPDALEVAEVLDQLAVALRRGGRAREPEAMEVCERALSIKSRTVGERDSSYAISLRNLGMLHSARGRPQAALPILERALRIQERAFSRDHSEVAMTLLAIGAAQSALGRDIDAVETLERAVRIQRGTLPSDDPDRALGLSSLAGLRYGLGDYSEAVRLGEEAVAILRKAAASDSPMLGGAYYTLGGTYSQLGDFDAARAAYEQALRIRGRGSSPNAVLAASTSVDLGYALQRLGRLRDARSRYLAALATYDREGVGDGPDAGWAKAKLGLCYLEMGDHQRAEILLRDALRIQEASLGPDDWQIWMTLRALAQTAAGAGDYDAAEKLCKRNLSLLEGAFGESHPDLATVLTEYSAFLVGAGDSMNALDTSLRAARMGTEHMRRTARGISERQGLAYGAVRPGGLDAALAILAAGTRGGDRRTVANVWDALIQQRTLVLDEITTRNRIASADTALGAVLGELERARRRLSNLSVRGPAGEDVDRYRRALSRARGDVDRLERALASQSAVFELEQAQAKAGLEEVLRALPDSLALVGLTRYTFGPSRGYLAFIGARKRGATVVRLGATGEIDSLVLAWRKAVARVPTGSAGAQRRIEKAYRRIGERLRQRIWDPIAPHIGKASVVCVVPEGPLHLVNWGALPAPTGGYMAESKPTFHLLNSERDLKRASVGPPSGVGLLACGDPDFDALPSRLTRTRSARAPGTRPVPAVSGKTTRGASVDCGDFESVRFGSLPGAAKEVREIAAEWPDSTSVLLLSGAAATENAVKKTAPGRRVVHLATHGFFLDEKCSDDLPGDAPSRGIGGISSHPEPTRRSRSRVERLRLSGIALAAANRRANAGPDEEDGILTAEEICSLNLNGLEWAVLSACDTGLGAIQTGEGVLGLRRSFQAAGARSVIMSLWEVDDQATCQWMKGLYHNRFHGGLGTAEAAREASLSLLLDRRARGRSTHPYYWAGFVAAGDWR